MMNLVETSLWFIPKNNPKHLSLEIIPKNRFKIQQSNKKSGTYYLHADLETTWHFLTISMKFMFSASFTFTILG